MRARACAHEQLIRVRFALIYYGALSHEAAREPMVHVEDIGIPAVASIKLIPLSNVMQLKCKFERESGFRP